MIPCDLFADVKLMRVSAVTLLRWNSRHALSASLTCSARCLAQASRCLARRLGQKVSLSSATPVPLGGNLIALCISHISLPVERVLEHRGARRGGACLPGLAIAPRKCRCTLMACITGPSGLKILHELIANLYKPLLPLSSFSRSPSCSSCSSSIWRLLIFRAC